MRRSAQGTPEATEDTNPATIGDWNYRKEVLMLERDVRGLVELVTTFKEEKAPKEMIMSTMSLAHFFAGRSSAAISVCKSVLEQNTTLPDITTLDAKLLLGILYYERSEYLKAKEAFKYIIDDTAGNKNMAMEYLSKIESRL